MPIIDWHCRYVLNWALRTTMDADFCIVALNEVLGDSLCEIFNTDQGSQFTTSLLAKGIKVSMGARGMALDNIMLSTYGVSQV